MKRILLAALLAGASFGASAQNLPTTPLNSTNVSSTISVTNTFQSVFAARTTGRGRAGCTIQNNGTHTMYVFAGAIASATTSNSVQIGTGQAYYCATGVNTISDQISITGTATDVFYAAEQ